MYYYKTRLFLARYFCVNFYLCLQHFVMYYIIYITKSYIIHTNECRNGQLFYLLEELSYNRKRMYEGFDPTNPASSN